MEVTAAISLLGFVCLMPLQVRAAVCLFINEASVSWFKNGFCA